MKHIFFTEVGFHATLDADKIGDLETNTECTIGLKYFMETMQKLYDTYQN